MYQFVLKNKNNCLSLFKCALHLGYTNFHPNLGRLHRPTAYEDYTEEADPPFSCKPPVLLNPAGGGEHGEEDTKGGGTEEE